MSKFKKVVNKRLKSFKHAFNGLIILIKEEDNAKIHLFIAICVIIAAISLKISLIGWIAIVLSIGIVIGFEAINTSIEHIADLFLRNGIKI